MNESESNSLKRKHEDADFIKKNGDDEDDYGIIFFT